MKKNIKKNDNEKHRRETKQDQKAERNEELLNALTPLATASITPFTLNRSKIQPMRAKKEIQKRKEKLFNLLSTFSQLPVVRKQSPLLSEQMRAESGQKPKN